MQDFVQAAKHRYWELLDAGRRVLQRRDVALLEQLVVFAPFSAGSPESRAVMAVDAAAQAFPLMSVLLEKSGSHARPVSTCTADAFCADGESIVMASQLSKLFTHYGSDKSRNHDYHKVYARLFRSLGCVNQMLEVGLGSNNVDVVSNMGQGGRPGASLRAFRDFLPGARIFGADIDRRILFEEDRIRTFFVDQTDFSSFNALDSAIPGSLDLLIDDGLHTVSANLTVLIFGLAKVRAGGWIVIEDISPAATIAWRVIAQLLPADCRCSLIEAKGGYLFVVERTASHLS